MQLRVNVRLVYLILCPINAIRSPTTTEADSRNVDHVDNGFSSMKATNKSQVVQECSFGGQGCEPYEQKTQQSPGIGLRRTLQPEHS